MAREVDVALDHARAAGRREASARAVVLSGAAQGGGGASGGTTVGLLLGFEGLAVDTGDEVSTVEVRRAHVDIAGEEVWLSANPGGYVIGGTVTVQIDGTRRPLYVLGPRSTAPVAGVDVAGAGETVTHLPDLSIDPEARSRSTEAWDKAQQAAADAADAREWVDETGQELVQRVGSAEGAIGTVGDVLEGVRSNVGRKMWSGDSFTSVVGTFTVEPVGSGRLRIAHVEGTSPAPVRYLFGTNDWTESFNGAAVVVEVPEPGTYSVVAFDAPDTTVASDVLGNLVVTAEMMSPDYGWVDMEWPDIDWSDAEIGLGQLRDAGLLDPDVWSRLFEDVVVGGVVAATEAFIGPNAIIDNAVQARHVVASESLWAKLATFARVTTDMLLVGGMNLLPDPRFEDAELTAGRMSRSAASEVSGGYQATGYFYWVPSTAAEDVRRYAVPVTAGDTYRIEVPVTLTSALSTTARLETWNADGTGRALRTATDRTYQDGVLSYTYTVPAGVAYLSPVIYRTTSYTVRPGARVTLMADSRLLVDGAVTARALNVVHELPSGDMLRIDPDGVRVWRGGNNGPNPNIALTAGDGFRIQTDTGDGLLWIDPATGDLHTDGAVLSNTTISAPEVTGGTFTAGTFRTGTTGRRVQIDPASGLRAWNNAGLPTLSMDPDGNIVIGGGQVLYDNPAQLQTTEPELWISDSMPVGGGGVYGWQARCESTPYFPANENFLEAVFTVGGVQQPVEITTRGTFHPVGWGLGLIEGSFTAPPGSTAVRLRYRRADTPTPPANNYIYISDVKVEAVAKGSIDLGGRVRAPLATFTEAELHSIRGSNGIAWDPSDTGWLPFDLQSNWIESGGYPPQRRKRGDMVYLRGEVRAVASSAPSTITTLPPGWRPAQRIRVPWGWGSNQTYVEVEPNGNVRSGSGARLASESSPGMSLAAIPPFSIV